MKFPKQFKRYISILLKSELDKITYDRKDDLYVILDLIHRKEVYYKAEYQDRYGFTEISLSQFKELIPSSDNLNRGIQFLVDNSLLLRNDYYKMGVTAKSYKIPREFLGEQVSIKIQDRNINRRINNQIKKHRKIRVKSLEFAKTDYYKTFKVDVGGANKAILEKAVNEIKKLCFNTSLSLSESDILDIIRCKKGHEEKRMLILFRQKGKELDNILHRYVIHGTRINAINDGFLFFKRNKTNGRLDTNLTSLPSYLRPYIISSENLINLDIKNSQPYFLYTLIKDNPDISSEELLRFGELVICGTLYEYMIERYEAETKYSRTRNQMKRMLYRIFFSKLTSYSKEKKIFGGLFPTIMAYINRINTVKHNTLAINLQSRESHTILDVIMPLLEQSGIRPYTIHDSFVCVESEAMRIKELFVGKLTELYGIAPALHMDYLTPTETIEDEIVEEWDEEFLKELNEAVDKS